MQESCLSFIRYIISAFVVDALSQTGFLIISYKALEGGCQC